MLMLATFNLDLAFSALADPTRRAILAGPAQGETTVRELAKPFEMTQPAVSQHLKGLEDAGLLPVAWMARGALVRPATRAMEARDLWLAMLRKALKKNAEEELRPAGRGSRRRGTTEDKKIKEEKNDEQVDFETER